MSNAHHTAHGEVITELISAGFLSPKPRMAGVRTWSMLLPSVAQVVGLCCFGVVAWSFTEFAGLPPAYRVTLVIFGSFAIAIGGSIGSLPATIECFRRDLSSWADWATLIFSGVASLVEMIMALSFLGGFDIAQSQPRIVLLATLATLDTCLGMGLLGRYLASHDTRLTLWQEEYKEAVRQYYALPVPAIQHTVPTGEAAYTPTLPEPAISGNGRYTCWCGWTGNKPQAMGGHSLKHIREVRQAEDAPAARELLEKLYPGTEVPELARIAQMRQEGEK